MIIIQEDINRTDCIILDHVYIETYTGKASPLLLQK